MTNTSLQDFVTNIIARRHLTFGDVRRLQRDCLPGGLKTREHAEMLICLNGKIDRADKAWAQWLVAAIADFAVMNERRSDAVEEPIVDWLERLLAATALSTKVGRNISRQLRREAKRLRAKGSLPAADSGTAEPQILRDRCAAPSGTACRPPEICRPQARSTPRSLPIILKSVTPARSPRRRQRESDLLIAMSPGIWSSGMAQKHLCYRLAAPYP
jgi:hypothetical protein